MRVMISVSLCACTVSLYCFTNNGVYIKSSRFNSAHPPDSRICRHHHPSARRTTPGRSRSKVRIGSDSGPYLVSECGNPPLFWRLDRHRRHRSIGCRPGSAAPLHQGLGFRLAGASACPIHCRQYRKFLSVHTRHCNAPAQGGGQPALRPVGQYCY